MTSSQTGSDSDEFEYTLPGTDRVITLNKPDEAQMAVMLRLESMLEDAPLAGAQLYMDTLGALMPEEDEQWCLRALLRHRLKIEVFTDLAKTTLYHFYPELEKAASDAERTSRTHGPAATRRPRRRS
jgi:hypothetical protein